MNRNIDPEESPFYKGQQKFPRRIEIIKDEVPLDITQNSPIIKEDQTLSYHSKKYKISF